MIILILLGFRSTLKIRSISGPEKRLRDFIPSSKFNYIIIYPEHGSIFSDLQKFENVRLVSYQKFSRIKILSLLIMNINKADILVSFGPYLFDFFISLISFLFKKKSIIFRLVNLSVDHISIYKHYFYRIIDKVFVSTATGLATISNTHRHQWSSELASFNPFFCYRFYFNKINVIYNGIYLNQKSKCSKPFEKNHIIISIIGHLAEEKGHELLFSSLKNLKTEFSFHLNVVGNGPSMKEFQKLVHDCSLDKQVTFLGYLEDVSSILQNTHIVVLPSLREGFPVTLLEASNYCCALIGSNVGAVGEIIIDDFNGYIFKKNNSNDLELKLRKLMSSLDLINKFGSNAYDHVQQFNFEKMSTEIDNYFLQISKI